MTADVPFRRIYLEDSKHDAELTQQAMERSQMVHSILWVQRIEGFQAALTDFRADVILSDHSLSGFTLLEALARAGQYDCDVPFILLKGHAGALGAATDPGHGTCFKMIFRSLTFH